MIQTPTMFVEFFRFFYDYVFSRVVSRLQLVWFYLIHFSCSIRYNLIKCLVDALRNSLTNPVLSGGGYYIEIDEVHLFSQGTGISADEQCLHLYSTFSQNAMKVAVRFIYYVYTCVFSERAESLEVLSFDKFACE